MDWDDLRYFSAVLEHGGLSGAARALNVSVQTVGRRIAALESEIGASLFVRHSGGYRPTADARRLAPEARAVETSMAAFEANLRARSARLDGPVRLAAPETIASRILLPDLGPFLRRHPALELELITGVATVGIARGEADIALRLLAPERGALTVRRVGTMTHGLFAAAGAETDLTVARLVGWPDEVDLPAARWLRRLAGRGPDVRLNHLDAHRAAIEAGIGLGVLPLFLGVGLVPVEAETPPSEPIFLVSHATDTISVRVRTVYDEIARIVGANAHRLAGAAASPA